MKSESKCDTGKVMGKIKVFLVNLKSFHHRLMMRYLQNRGWVVFYLEKRFRKCDGECCWLGLYESEQSWRNVKDNSSRGEAIEVYEGIGIV